MRGALGFAPIGGDGEAGRQVVHSCEAYARSRDRQNGVPRWREIGFDFAPETKPLWKTGAQRM
jgi:hypothetical protein